MSDLKVEKISGPILCGEGPHWDSERQYLYFVDLDGAHIYRYVPSTKELYEAKVIAPSTTFILPVKGTTDKFVVGIDHSFALLTWDGISPVVPASDWEVLHTVELFWPKNRLNDGKTDARGRVFGGTLGPKIHGVWQPGRGALYSFGKDGKLRTNFDGIGISNGLVWSADTRTLYWIDSLPRTIYALDYDITTGKTSNRRPIFNLKMNGIKGQPDGMTIDTNGHLWIALYGGGGLIVVNPDKRTLVRKIDIPGGRFTTSVAFGGKNMDELYVTTAYKESPYNDLAFNNEAGCTFRITGLGVTGYPGVPANLRI